MGSFPMACKRKVCMVGFREAENPEAARATDASDGDADEGSRAVAEGDREDRGEHPRAKKFPITWLSQSLLPRCFGANRMDARGDGCGAISRTTNVRS